MIDSDTANLNLKCHGSIRLRAGWDADEGLLHLTQDGNQVLRKKYYMIARGPFKLSRPMAGLALRGRAP